MEPRAARQDNSVAKVFSTALKVMNEALEKNASRFPYQQIIHASERTIGDIHFGVAVYADDAARPLAFFTVQLQNRKLELLFHGVETASIVWRVPLRFLERVVNNPRVYIDNPEKLEWDWLRLRFGIS